MLVMERLLGAPEDLTDGERERWAASIELGRRAGTGDKAARRALVKGAGAVTSDDGLILYLGQVGFAEVVGIGSNYLRKLRALNRLIEPEAVAGNRRWGWSIGRVIMWAIEYGYLTADLEPTNIRRGRVEAVATLNPDDRPHWRFDTVAYLTHIEAGEILGITDDSVHQARQREAGPRESIKIGGIPAFDKDVIHAFNLRRPPHMRARSQDPDENTA